jgi:predicted DNA-binding protein
MTKNPYQTCLRMPLALKEDMTSICDRLSINESDLMRKAITDFVKNLNETPDTEHRYLFA